MTVRTSLSNQVDFTLVRIIKMSSPKLNNIIILGCILCYASVVLFGLDARFLDMKGYGINCNVRERLFIYLFLPFGYEM